VPLLFKKPLGKRPPMARDTGVDHKTRAPAPLAQGSWRADQDCAPHAQEPFNRGPGLTTPPASKPPICVLVDKARTFVRYFPSPCPLIWPKRSANESNVASERAANLAWPTFDPRTWAICFSRSVEHVGAAAQDKESRQCSRFGQAYGTDPLGGHGALGDPAFPPRWSPSEWEEGARPHKRRLNVRRAQSREKIREPGSRPAELFFPASANHSRAQMAALLGNVWLRSKLAQ